MLSKELLAEINAHSRRVRFAPFVAAAAAVGAAAALLLSGLLAFAVLLTGAAATWAVWRLDRERRTTSLFYSPGAAGDRFAAVGRACEALSGAGGLWRVGGPGGRSRAEVGLLETPGISANISIWGLDVGDSKLLFFPECVLVREGEEYRAVPYASLGVALSAHSATEEDAPADAEVVEETWRYVREDGGRDLRFSRNPRLKTVRYALLDLTGAGQPAIRLQASDRVAAARFARALSGAGSQSKASSGTSGRAAGPRDAGPRNAGSRSTGSQSAARDGSSGEEQSRRESSRAAGQVAASAYEVLGIEAGASRREVTAAYRSLAKRYHPDRVADLEGGSRREAETRMKEINAAYAELKHLGR